MVRRATVSLMYIVLAAAIGAWAASVFVFQPYGHRAWAFTAIAAVAAASIGDIRFRAGRDAILPVSLAACVRISRRILTGTMTIWLGLIAWSSISPGGTLPAGKHDPDVARVVTWNILHGSERGAPWSRFGWAVRKEALRSALEGTRPDILCVQEALAEQVEAIALMLPGFEHSGVGRDDGRSGGEYCAIYFDAVRFQKLGDGTFWLEDPSDLPPRSLLLGPKRICTWVRLRDRHTGRSLRVYNTHLYLSEPNRVSAVGRILERISHGEPTDAVLVAGDFNAGPGSPNRRLFEQSGLRSSAERIGLTGSAPTYQFYGLRLRSLDEILVDHRFRVREHRVLDVKPSNTYPSDHFGVMADLVLSDTTNSR
jgi:endonuclease/exonuclease/phosphatase family metal-dependent hydrolase